MKTFLLLLFLQSAIPKNANEIVVKASFDQVKMALNSNGYTVKEYIKDFGIIKTEPKSTEYTFDLQLTIKMIGDSAYIKGNCITAGYYNFTAENLKYRSVPKVGFEEMNKFALSIDSNLTYKIIK